ncbi:uncharacterized protein LOC133347389 [Lethenteron reissneri]|uniref:uncharacterized protein LOC133347389 n=1 Tax=Lethenteron reissneri TaxID=7753 RepID=UPI002AB788AF|nr:uncharacterized protein LOC133347389 [Lethenteron reissneri]
MMMMLQTSAPSAHDNSRGTAMSPGTAAPGTRPHPWEAPQTSPQIPRCTTATRRRPPPATREDTGAAEDDDDGDDDRGDGGGDDDDDDGCGLLRSCERRLAFRQEVGTPRRGAGARLLLPARERPGKGTSAGATGGISSSSSSRRPGTARRNARERNRVALVNRGFAALRDRVPAALGPSWTPQQDSCPGGPLSPGSSGEGAGSSGPTRLSKVETLRAAAEYIRALQRLLMLSESPRYYPEVTASPVNISTTTGAASSSPSTITSSTTGSGGSRAAEPCYLASWFGLDAKCHPLFDTHEQPHEASPAWTGHEFWTGAGHVEIGGGSFLQTSQEPGLGWAPAEPRSVGHGAVPAPPLAMDTWGNQRTFGLSISSASSSYSY